MRERHRARKEQYIAYKGGSCERCGYSKSLTALEFHHTDPEGKDFGLSTRALPWGKAKAELDKCLLLCSNCHREEHERLMNEKHAKLEEAVRAVIPRRIPEGPFSYTCVGCGKPFEDPHRKGRLFCSNSCNTRSQEKLDWPEDEDLARLVWESPLSQLAKVLGVSDSAIRKRCKSHGIKTPKKGHWSKTTIKV